MENLEQSQNNENSNNNQTTIGNGNLEYNIAQVNWNPEKFDINQAKTDLFNQTPWPFSGRMICLSVSVIMLILVGFTCWFVWYYIDSFDIVRFEDENNAIVFIAQRIGLLGVFLGVIIPSFKFVKFFFSVYVRWKEEEKFLNVAIHRYLNALKYNGTFETDFLKAFEFGRVTNERKDEKLDKKSFQLLKTMIEVVRDISAR
ncbi:MAG: hypothetical protein HUJ68_02130 [Clostridia bacterium]|nr:hypothetical protein [Clostridia bacterium]